LLPAGDHRLNVGVSPGHLPPDGLLIEPFEFTLQPGQVFEFVLPKFEPLPEYGSVNVICGETTLSSKSYIPGASVYAYRDPDACQATDTLLRVYDGDEVHRWQRVVRNGKTHHELRLPERVEVRLAKSLVERFGDSLRDDLRVRLLFGGYSCIPQRVSPVMHLWAPPGRAVLVVDSRNPRFAWTSELQIEAGKTIVVEPGDELCEVRFSDESIPADAATGQITPLWGVWNAAGRFVAWVEKTEMVFHPGDYLARPAFGTDRDVRFTARRDEPTQVALSKLAPTDCNGALVVNPPPGFSASDKMAFSVMPASWSGQGWWQDATSRVGSTRVTADGLRVEGVLVGVPMRVTGWARPLDHTSKFEWECSFEVTLNGTAPAKIEAEWKRVPWD
jgi:hypothetical protein